MRFFALSLALCAAVQAIPIASLDDATNEIARREDGAFDESIPTIDSADEEGDLHEEELDSDLMSDEGLKFLSTEDDPAFAPIFQHVEDILQSDASAKDQIQRILDAIVHDKESWRDAHEEHLSSDEVVEEIFKILGGEETSDEKIDEIFNKITQHTNHNQRVELALDDSEAAVLHRISWILDGPESAQKRIQKMLNELADHLHPDAQHENLRYSATLKDFQETFGDVEEDRYIAADVQEDIDGDPARDDSVSRRLKDTIEDIVGSVWL